MKIGCARVSKNSRTHPLVETMKQLGVGEERILRRTGAIRFGWFAEFEVYLISLLMCEWM